MKDCLTLIVALSLACCMNLAAAQTEPLNAPGGTVTLSGTVSLSRLVDLCAEKLNISITYDAATMKGDVQLRLGRPIAISELWALTNSSLLSKGFATVRRPGTDVLAVVQLRGLKNNTTIEFEATDAPRGGFRSVVVEVPVGFGNRAAATLAELKSDAGHVAAIQDTPFVLLFDRADRIEAMTSLLERIARDHEAVESRRVALSERAASEIVADLAALNAKRLEVSGTERPGGLVAHADGSAVTVIAPRESLDAWLADINDLDQPAPIARHSYAVPWLSPAELASSLEAIARISTGPSGSRDGWKITPDELTGVVFVSGSTGEHARIREWLEGVIAGGPPSARTLKAFRIDHRAASDLAELLDKTISSATFESVVRTGGSDAEDTSVPRQAPGDGPVITVDEPTNTLFIYATPAEAREVQEFIDLLDVRQSQVLLDFTLISLNESNARDLGIELQYLIDDESTLFRLTSLFGLTDISPDDPSTAVSGSGGTAVVLDPSDYSAVIRALESVSDGRSLIQPQLLVANNEEASLDSVEQQPFISTNASDTVATTSFGGTQDAGTTLSVTPQITAGDELTIRYSVSLSTFIGESADPALPPPSLDNSVTSVATIPDGFAMAIGGIVTNTEAEAESKVPVLGDIPLLGELFKSRSSSRSLSKFYVIIRAQIFRAGGFEDLKYLGELQSSRLDLDDGWPVLEPRVIR